MIAQINSTCISKTNWNSIDLLSGTIGHFVVKILDTKGKMAKIIKGSTIEDAHQFLVDVNDLKTGSYVMNVFNDVGFVKSIRYTKQ